MALFIIILLLLFMWFSLLGKMQKFQIKIDELTKEIKTLGKPAGMPQTEKKVEITERPPLKKPQPVIVEKTSRPEPKIKKEKAPVNYEKYIGENLFGKLGILILIIGMGFFVKYAIDNNWINEALRTILGFAVGSGLIALSWVLRKKYHAFSSVLAGGGFAIFYVTVAIAYHYYALFSQPAAFIILVLFTMLMSGLAVLYDRRELALVALVGGFVAPFLVGNGSGNYMVLLTYILILDMGMFGLSLYKKWGELPIACFVLTWLVFGLYLSDTPLSVAGNIKLTRLLLFATLFYLIFQASVAPVIRINQQRINQLLIGVVIVNNFIFLYYALTLHWGMRNIPNYGGLITLFAALINAGTFFWIRKRGERFPFLRQTFLWLALAFVSITFPIQLEGSMITVFWASELVIVMMLYSRFRLKACEFFTLLLAALTLISYLMDVENVFRWGASPDAFIFINGHFITGLLVGASFLVCAFLLEKVISHMPANGWIKYSPHNAIALITATIVFYVAFVLDFYLYIDDKLFALAMMRVFTAAVLFLLTWLFHSRFGLLPYIKAYMILFGLSAIAYISLSNSVNHAYDSDAMLRVFQWAALLIIIAHGVYIVGYYYRQTRLTAKGAKGIILYLSILFTLLLIVTAYNLLSLLSLSDEANAGLSVSLGIAGFTQMAFGMRLHLKPLRIISLATFGIVLLKLVLVDLWSMPTIGKIIVFIILGILLLVLSFLYQKLKAVLFDDDKER
ncbi:MAG: DUF2339 domain-containing protein [Tannerellaceae bacterium]|nr:DUF2339 domain-containing protein [Tannerellaceae bacterium]